jgi:hypothetical protein
MQTRPLMRRLVAPDGRQARLRPCRQLAGTAWGAPSAQRRSMRVRYTGALDLADLPVDRVVVLEQQERAGHA